MVDALESAKGKPPLGATLEAGLDVLSLSDKVVFTRYLRLVLPLDGYVFWVRADLLTPAAQLNAMGLNEVTADQLGGVRKPAATMTVKGSLHYGSTQAQNEAETEGVNTVVFTALSPVQQFNDVQPGEMWIGRYAGDREGDDGPITFAFSQRGKYYKQADLFHYVGTAVLPVFRPQLIDYPAQLSTAQLIVSNSLPLWLSLSSYDPPYDGFANHIPLYPSFLLPDNLPPPYGAVHVDPAGTEALETAPVLDATLGQCQLAQDKVRVTLYGCNNDAAQTFLSAVLQFSYDENTLGIVNMPVVRDDKRSSSELGVLAQRKIIDFEVTYDQGCLRQVTRALIEQAIVGYVPDPAAAA